MAEEMSERRRAGQSHTETYCNAYQAAEKELLTAKGVQRFGSVAKSDGEEVSSLGNTAVEETPGGSAAR